MLEQTTQKSTSRDYIILLALVEYSILLEYTDDLYPYTKRLLKKFINTFENKYSKELLPVMEAVVQADKTKTFLKLSEYIRTLIRENANDNTEIVLAKNVYSLAHSIYFLFTEIDKTYLTEKMKNTMNTYKLHLQREYKIKEEDISSYKKLIAFRIKFNKNKELII